MLRAVDTETFLIRPGLLAPPPVCVSAAWDEGGPRRQFWSFRESTEGLDQVESWLETDELVFHNAAFDLAEFCVARESLIPLVFKALRAGRIHDTRIRQELLDIAAGRRQKNGANFVFRDGAWVKTFYSLADICKRWLGKDRSVEKADPNGWRLRFADLADVPAHEWPDEAVYYVLEDAADPLDIYHAQEEAHGGPIEDEAAQVRAAWALHLMSCWGVRVDVARVAKLKTALEEISERNFARLLKVGFYRPRRATAEERRQGKVDFEQDGKAWRYSVDKKRLQERVVKVYHRLKRPVPMTDGTVDHPPVVSTSKDTLLESGSRLLALMSEEGGVDRVLTTYIPALEQGTKGPINLRFNVLVNSGRTSSHGEKRESGEVMGFNGQNLPTGRRVGGVRECIVPRDGYVLCSVDYEAAELRSWAQCCLWLFGSSRMAELFREGKDPHLYMAGLLLKTSYEEAERRYKAKDPEAKRKRDCGKVPSFGYIGGLGPKTLVTYARESYKVRLTDQEAYDLKRIWGIAYPEGPRYLAYINQIVGEGEQASIRQFVSNRLRGRVGYCDGANTLFQGLTADGAKHALFRVAEECYVDCGTPLYGCRPVNFLHDEILAELPEWKAHEAAHRLAEVMREAMAEYVPDVPIKAAPALMRRWYKQAEAVHDSSGRLIPWEPTPEVPRAA